MAAVDISPKKDGGVLKEIIKEGIGEETPAAGCKVKVHYTGTLMDGTKFDSSKDRNEPFEFDLGKKSVIKAWDIGVATMKRGEVAILTCAPDYAYRAAGSPPTIPPNATLKFEIEMIDWKGADLSPEQDNSIEKFQIVTGSGYITPNEGALVDVHLVGSYDGKVFEEKDVQFNLGEGEDVGIIDGVEIALRTFKMGEKSRLKIKSKHAYKNIGEPKFGIPPNADLEYTVELKNFEKASESWMIPGPDQIKQLTLFKEKGTAYFKEGKLGLATKFYNKIITAFKDSPSSDEEEEETEAKDLRLSVNLNLALCYLKSNKSIEARDACTEALAINPNNEKALFRRGQANILLAAPELALKDFEEVLKINPKNTAAANQIIACKKLHKEQLAREKKIYANMFDKFALQDKQKEEEKLRGQPDVMRGVLGEWGQEERPGGRDATAFEKENPNILMLNANGTGEFKNM
ncbi:FK506-binding protein 59 isoform X1 [Neodiprion pinetum]|uniref:peptidylprolyl isomerase n=2 Tax=Neodiprion lecontei TaxID=441921 RepID=A0A6J0BH86_NEOLC|nr:FK506-binding protein 59 isoform X1 [Neodiprion lecontei]XP_046488091.1 FK506-binding protein 59 isoform X1 [Neodiprion pinetum]XP_046488092.1 FK506-binding protein 59 isoform X1 [Neodiprion pinetum]XP_046599333.1 FK506-binding protein 59 isoform X1 [Neodiprion lecontei]